MQTDGWSDTKIQFEFERYYSKMIMMQNFTKEAQSLNVLITQPFAHPIL